MKLRSLNCPNCGSILRKEGDMQICESCGSAFAIDYDESDVEYERATKEDELNRQRYEHEKEMLETEHRLREEEAIRREKRVRTQQRNDRAKAKAKGCLTSIISLGIFALLIFLAIRFVKNQLGEEVFNSLAEINITTETTVSPYLITASDVLADEDFMRNAKAACLSNVHSDRDNNEVTTYDLPVTNWTIEGEPEIYDCYLLTSEKGNRICFFVRMTYKSSRDDELKEVYDCICLKNITVSDEGKIKSDYAAFNDRGEGATDWTWDAALDADQLYRSAILGKSDFKNEKVELAVSEETDASDASDTADTAEAEAADAEGEAETEAAEGS